MACKGHCNPGYSCQIGIKSSTLGAASLSPRSVVLLLCLLVMALQLISCSLWQTKSSSSGTSPTAAMDVLTFHNDNARTGQYLNETALTLKNVRTPSFGKVGFFAVDGKVDAQPLFLSGVMVPGKGVHPMLYVVTEHGSVFALDAITGEYLWTVSLLGAGENTSDPRGCDEAVNPEIGITATPVIDRTKGPNGAIYVVAMSKDKSGNYFQRLHALDLGSGAELFGGPKTITALYPGTGDGSSGGSVIFSPGQYKDRAALLLVNGVVYTTWASHCDQRPYTGWIIGYDAATLNQASVFNVTPNGNGGAVWMSGSGPAADSQGNIYLLDGNGTFDTTLDGKGFPSQGNFGNGFLKLSTQGGTLAVADYFEMADQQEQNDADSDLGSGGTVLLPDQADASGKVWHLAVGAGKASHLYLVDRDAMGKFNPSADASYQHETTLFSGRVYSTPAFFNGTVFYGVEGDQIKAFKLQNARFPSAPSSTTHQVFPYPGATPSVSANGTKDAILWAVENGYSATLHAYDASDLSKELYNTNQAPFVQDQVGPGNKFITPTIANGRVYVGTTYGVAVFGLR
jgi:hypothetical protein